MLINPREIFNEMIGMIGRIGRIGQCTMIPMIPMIPLLHSGRIGNDWGNTMLNYQRELATPGQVPGVSQEAPDHWTVRPMLPLPKCFISQCFSQWQRMPMTEKMTSLGLVFGLTNFVNFYHFLSAPMRFIMEGCHEQ